MVAKRKKPEEPPLEIKSFTAEDITLAIAKLNRRIGEVKGLQTDRVRFDDQRADNVTHNIRDAVLEIFGPNSPEYRTHQYHSFHPSVTFIGKSDREDQADFEVELANSVTMLEGLVARLKEKQEEIQQDATARVRSSFEGLDLHPRIAAASAELYRDGHYRNAVLDASLALLNLVKEKSRRHDLDGATLMTTVFSKNSPILAFNDLKDQIDRDEQEGMMHLFVGATLALRNPRAHTLLIDPPEQALEYIALLSLLAKRVDQAKRLITQ